MSISDDIRSWLMPKPRPDGMKNPGIELNGDSIMEAGIGAALTERGFTIVDRSVAGDTAWNAWRRFAYCLRSVDTIVFEHGTNDLTAGEMSVVPLSRMVEHALAEGRRVIVTGIPQREAPCKGNWEKDNYMIDRIAEKYRLSHARWDRVEPSFGPDDKLHPDAAFRDRLVDALATTI